MLMKLYILPVLLPLFAAVAAVFLTLHLELVQVVFVQKINQCAPTAQQPYSSQ